MVGGRSPRQKGNRTERALRHYLMQRGVCGRARAAVRLCRRPLRQGPSAHIGGRDHIVEVKCRSNGFAQLYEWLDGRDMLIVKADRREPLVILPLALAAEIAVKAK